MSFNNKVVWITGASSGIGEAMAYALAKRGAKLILSARREDELERVKEKCAINDIKIVPLDLADTASLPQKASEALCLWGKIDYLFNNGGMSQRSFAIDTDMEVIRRVMEVNFFGTVALTKAVLPAMIEAGEGHIVVTSSIMGKFGTKYRSTYAASKHALHGWFDCLRQEVSAKNINVTLVCPGFIKTDITFNAIEGDGRKHGKMSEGQAHGMPPQTFVEKLLPGVLKGKQEIYIGGKELAGVYLKRLSPRLLDMILQSAKIT